MIHVEKTNEFSYAATPSLKECNARYAITFGESAILHIGGKEYGNGRRDVGFTVQELWEISDNINRNYPMCSAKVISISSVLPNHLQTDETNAAVLVIRNGAGLIQCDQDKDNNYSFSADKLLAEQQTIEYDNKYFDTRRQKTLNKRARYNIVFSADKDGDIKHSDDYRQCSVKSFMSMPYLSKFRDTLPKAFGQEKASNLEAEGNYYYEDKSGIGFHGDSERKTVICLSLGKPSILRYQWRLPNSSEHTFTPVDINIGHGDVYLMSEKATGYDWRMRSKVRVVHAAGATKYIGSN
tara:strand:- start:69 stop:956 length:888 start_codon:yes stop_codon:yes gene_type:complete